MRGGAEHSRAKKDRDRIVREKETERTRIEYTKIDLCVRALLLLLLHLFLRHANTHLSPLLPKVHQQAHLKPYTHTAKGPLM